MGTACSTAASAAAEPAEKGHLQRLWMPALSPSLMGEAATAAATGMALQEATTPGAPGGCPASTAAGGPPAEERARTAAAAGARSSTGTSTAAPAAAGRRPCLLNSGDDRESSVIFGWYSDGY